VPRVFTIGHSTRLIEPFLELLAEHDIRRLVDVRRYPGSRRHPQFSRDALAASLAAAGVEYVHEPDLGGRRAARPDSPHTAWRVEAFRGYADHMETPEFGAALERLIRCAAGTPTAILCAEAVPWRCHRRLISDALLAQGVEVLHILGPGRADPHELDPNARILPGGRLLYAGPAGDQPSLF
jgi:uncharacterized protein (DUF488 family)